MISITHTNFNISQIAASGQCFRMYRLADAPATFEVLAGNKRVVVSQSGDANPGSTITFDCSQEDFDNFWFDYFDLGTDYGEIISKIDPEDEYLKAAATSCPGIRILRQDPWEMLVTFLISQQNNIPRITNSVRKICEKYGEKCVAYDGGSGTATYYAFPRPEALAGLNEDALMSEGLGYRSKYVVRCARDVLSGKFVFPDASENTYEEAKRQLMTLYGVGPKVADCICLFGLHMVDAFPIDTHIKQILESHYKAGFPFEKYEGFAGILQQYMFYYDLHK